MSGHTVKIRSSGGGEFDCYVAAPKADGPVPAIVLASAVHGVDADIRAIADEFAAKDFVAAAPDLFWRSVPGPLSRDDERAAKRSQPRLQRGPVLAAVSAPGSRLPRRAARRSL